MQLSLNKNESIEKVYAFADRSYFQTNRGRIFVAGVDKRYPSTFPFSPSRFRPQEIKLPGNRRVEFLCPSFNTDFYLTTCSKVFYKSDGFDRLNFGGLNLVGDILALRGRTVHISSYAGGVLFTTNSGDVLIHKDEDSGSYNTPSLRDWPNRVVRVHSCCLNTILLKQCLKEETNVSETIPGFRHHALLRSGVRAEHHYPVPGNTATCYIRGQVYMLSIGVALLFLATLPLEFSYASFRYMQFYIGCRMFVLVAVSLVVLHAPLPKRYFAQYC